MILGYFGKTPVAPDAELVKLASEKMGLEPTTEKVVDINDKDEKKGIAPAKKLLEDNDLETTEENIFNKCITHFALFLLLSNATFSQDINSISFGNVSIDELKMTHYEKDSTAKAVVLLEKGFISVNNSRKNKFVKKHYVKIKILKNTAFDLGTIKIPYYKKNEIIHVVGYTYNLSEEGEIEKSILTHDNFFLTRLAGLVWAQKPN
jgi:hypothetical protein